MAGAANGRARHMGHVDLEVLRSEADALLGKLDQIGLSEAAARMASTIDSIDADIARASSVTARGLACDD